MANTDDLFSDTKFLDIYPYKYVLRQNDVQENVFIDLMSGNLSRERIIDNGTKKSTMGIKAVYGIIELEKAKYLIVVTKSNMIGSIYSRKIFQATKFEFLPITPDRRAKEADKKYIDMLQDLFNTKFFYFSDEYDLTSSFQQFIINEADKNKFNPAYCYNENCITSFIQTGAFEWICPFITGYINISYTQINDKDFDFILISRRDKRRVGLRFHSRGTDLDGNCSNMAEQESIVVLNNNVYDREMVQIYSYVQTRGSMPFKWRQTPTLKWAPKGYVQGNDQENQVLCQKHFDDQCQHFPRQTLLNLIDKKGTQKMLGSYFEQMATGLKNKNIRFIWFDFHAECKKMKYENLSKLLAQVPEELKDYGYFHFQYCKNKPSEVEIHSRQVGVFRTNCMDCLDRTNVVQSVLARQILHKVLHIADLLPTPSGDPFQKFPDKLEETFRAVWTRNADVMSILYSGTGALKTDFTRTGKRTKQGALQDGRNAIQRYFLNNFYDAHKQNTYSLLLGYFKPVQQTYKKPAVNPLFLLLGVICFGYLFLSNLSMKYIHPMYLEQSQIDANLKAGENVHSGGIALGLTETIFILSGLGIILKLIQTFNGIFVPKPIVN